jgi:hypothetical protein
MSFLNIQSALAQRLEATVGIPAIAWGGVKYNPVKGTSFVRPLMISNDSTAQSFDFEHVNTGTYLISVFVPLGNGEGPLLTLCDSIVTQFKGGQTLTQSGSTIHVLNVGIEQIVKTDAWLQCNINVAYKNIQ